MRTLRGYIERTKAGARALGEGNSSYKPWDVENCAEIWAVRNAIMNGVKFENIIMKTVYYRTLIYAPACKNCANTFNELIKTLRVLKK